MARQGEARPRAGVVPARGAAARGIRRIRVARGAAAVDAQHRQVAQERRQGRRVEHEQVHVIGVQEALDPDRDAEGHLAAPPPRRRQRHAPAWRRHAAPDDVRGRRELRERRGPRESGLVGGRDRRLGRVRRAPGARRETHPDHELEVRRRVLADGDGADDSATSAIAAGSIMPKTMVRLGSTIRSKVVECRTDTLSVALGRRPRYATPYQPSA